MLEKIANSGTVNEVLVHIAIFVIFLVSLLLYITKRDNRVYKYLSGISGPASLPILGNALSLLVPHEQLVHVLMGWVNRYGTCFPIWIGNVAYVFISNPYDAEKILSSTVHINKGKDYELFLNPWLGTGLLTAPREKWHSRRKMLTPTFHFKILEDFLPIFNKQAQILTTVLEEQRLKTDVFDICPFVSKCTLDVICETAMGEKINAQIGGQTDYVESVCRLTDIVVMKGLNPIYRNRYIWSMTRLAQEELKHMKFLHGFTDKMISDRKADRKRRSLTESENSVAETTNDEPAGAKRRKAFLDLLLDLQESENILTDADIREEVDTFMFEGHDTTGANVDWALLMLACNPDCQVLVHKELEDVFGSNVGGSRNITMDDLKKLKYLECCIKETLRLYPSVPFFMRSVDQDIPLDEKRTIPKGTTVMVSPYTMHRFPEMFPEPEKFNPERFSTENSIGRHPYAYVPFSAGARNCIGQKFALYEEKIILATLLQKFRVEAVDTEKTVAMIPDVILRPKNGIKVRLIKRYN